MAQAPANPAKKKILIIEDDQSASDILSKKFTEEGFDVMIAVNGQDGLKKFDDFMPQVILLDLYMPVMDGHTFLDKLRDHPQGAATPVIVLSNWVGHDSVINAFDKQVVDYLLKTNTGLSVIVEKVKKIVGE